jgi:hypothetical protein
MKSLFIPMSIDYNVSCKGENHKYFIIFKISVDKLINIISKKNIV